MRLIIALMLILLSGCQSALTDAVNADNRTPSHIERDRYRHPQQTLAFLGIKSDMTVVEIWPGPQGWYTEILAPLLRERGKLYAAHFPADSAIAFYTKSLQRFEYKMTERPDVYDRVTITHLYPPTQTDIAPAGSADAVLTFRNVHNWLKAGTAEQAFRAFFVALKPGGTLGVVEHRAPQSMTTEEQIDSGYISESEVIKLAEHAGFIFEKSAEINANAMDTRIHPEGVWTLPPSLRLGDQDREKYLQIGESDRMTLRFRKPN